MPAIVDDDPAEKGAPVSVFESGAILVYLAEKTGKFLPKDLRGRFEVMEWLFWQMANLGPVSGHNNHFANYAVDKIPYAIKRFRDETNRLYAVMDKRLAEREFLAGAVFDRRHGVLSLDRAAGSATARIWTISRT